jgi:hypothetical protein
MKEIFFFSIVFFSNVLYLKRELKKKKLEQRLAFSTLKTNFFSCSTMGGGKKLNILDSRDHISDRLVVLKKVLRSIVSKSDSIEDSDTICQYINSVITIAENNILTNSYDRSLDVDRISLAAVIDELKCILACSRPSFELDRKVWSSEFLTIVYTMLDNHIRIPCLYRSSNGYFTLGDVLQCFVEFYDSYPSNEEYVTAEAEMFSRLLDTRLCERMTHIIHCFVNGELRYEETFSEEKRYFVVQKSDSAGYDCLNILVK